VREQMTLLKIDEHTSKLEEMDVEGIWRSLSAFFRAPRTCGCKPLWINDSACSSCSSRRESHSTETALLEPP